MKVKVTEQLIDVRDNEALMIEKKKKGSEEMEMVPMTLRFVSTEALGVMLRGEESESQEVKLKRGKLIERICLEEECEMSIEEVALVKERIAKIYGPLVVVAVEKILDPK